LLFRTSQEAEARIVTVVGLVLILCVAIPLTVFFWADPFGGRPKDQFGIVIETPYVGQGVQPGTAFVMHGVKVGQVTDIASMKDGGVRILADLERAPTAGLTNTMGIDFRPANYFGITGINLTSGQGGNALAEGSVIDATPTGNFTLQALLSRLGQVTNGVVTPRLISVVEKATAYTDGLDPLLDTMLTVSNSVTNVQTVSTEVLLANTTGIGVAFPGFANAATELGDKFVHASLDDATEDFFQNTYKPTIALTSGGLFGAVGNLIGSHSAELAPVTDLIRVLADVVPALVPSDAVAQTARELRTRLERMFAGPPDRRAINVRVILDSLPGVAAPIDAMGGAPQ
jgi:hypothetical protein